MHMFSLCLPPHHHQQWRRPSAALHKGGRAAFGGAPTFVDSIVGDGEEANIAKTYAYTYQMCPHFHICHLSYHLSYIGSYRAYPFGPIRPGFIGPGPIASALSARAL